MEERLREALARIDKGQTQTLKDLFLHVALSDESSFVRLQDNLELNVTLKLLEHDFTDDTLVLLQGAILMHHSSRRILCGQLNRLLTHIEGGSRCAVSTLVCCMADSSTSLRQLERADGLRRLSSVFRKHKLLQMPLLEFFYLYLSKEAPCAEARSVEEKQKLLGAHLAHVDALVDDLQKYKPFEIAS
ncbi:hypothetical protein PYCC9005_001317 [Savitreella phatthalungensis]